MRADALMSPGCRPPQRKPQRMGRAKGPPVQTQGGREPPGVSSTRSLPLGEHKHESPPLSVPHPLAPSPDVTKSPRSKPVTSPTNSSHQTRQIREQQLHFLTWQSLLEDRISSSWKGFTRPCQTQWECLPPSSFTGSIAPLPSLRVSHMRSLQSSPALTSCPNKTGVSSAQQG